MKEEPLDDYELSNGFEAANEFDFCNIPLALELTQAVSAVIPEMAIKEEAPSQEDDLADLVLEEQMIPDSFPDEFITGSASEFEPEGNRSLLASEMHLRFKLPLQTSTEIDMGSMISTVRSKLSASTATYSRANSTKKFSCAFPGCDAWFTQEELYLRHKKAHDKPQAPPTDIFMCTVKGCGRRFTQRDLFDYHKRYGHRVKENTYVPKPKSKQTKVRPYLCGACGKRFSTLWYYGVHRRKQHGEHVNLRKSQQQLPYPTRQLQLAIESTPQPSTSRSSNVNQVEKPMIPYSVIYECSMPQCKQRFDRKYLIDFHLKKFHGLANCPEQAYQIVDVVNEKSYVTPRHQYSYQRPNPLANAIMPAEDEGSTHDAASKTNISRTTPANTSSLASRPMPASKKKAALEETKDTTWKPTTYHQLSRNGLTGNFRGFYTPSKQYACPVDGCVKRFSSSWYIGVHVKKCHPEEPFDAASVTGMKDVPERRYKCVHCKFSSARRYRLNQHINSYHQAETTRAEYTCDFEDCGRKFHKRKAYARHRKLHDAAQVLSTPISELTRDETKAVCEVVSHIIENII